jgi:hypothetical protein
MYGAFLFGKGSLVDIILIKQGTVTEVEGSVQLTSMKK